MNYRDFFKLVAVGLLLAVLSACGSHPTRAPVAERGPHTSAKRLPPATSDWRPAMYTVQKGDTLYSVALEHGQDYKELAEWNGIAPPYVIRIGQVLRMGPADSERAQPYKPSAVSEAKPLPPMPTQPVFKSEPKALKQPYSDQALAKLEHAPSKVVPPVVSKAETKAETKPDSKESAKPDEKPDEVKRPSETAKTDTSAEDEKVDWAWPAEGKIIGNFNDDGSSKGLDIAGPMGHAVLAAAAGKVVHTGNTLRGYGKLIIIKHNKSYFSVYAHNSQVLVREGQTVLKGQKIAEMGNSDADRVKLHFEIRHLGKPVDPLKYLPNDRSP